MSAGMMATLRPRSRRSLSVGALVGILVCSAALAAGALIAAHSSSSRSTAPSATEQAQRAAIATWEAAIHPAVLSASQVVALGPREGVSEVANRTQPAPQLLMMAIGWHARLTVIAQQLAAVSTPSFLRPAHDLLDQAMTGYVNAAHSLLTAVNARGARRTSLLAAATADGKTADHIYDQAVTAIAAWRARLGLATDWSAS